MYRLGPTCRTTKASLFIGVANTMLLMTYGIMINWVYEGYVDLWFGIYGLDEDDDEDD